MSKVLLFGASGFVGRHVREALERDPRVSDVDSPGRDRHDLLRDDVAALTRLVAQSAPDVVINCTGRLTGTAEELLQANAMVTGKLIDAVSAVAPGIRLVRLGSAAEYGPVRGGRGVNEEDRTNPVSEYGISHLAGTQLMKLASGAGRIDGAVMRVFNPIGPGMHEENLLGRASAALRHALRFDEPQIVLGRLDAARDFVDVRDLATAVVAAGLAPVLPKRVFNVGSGKAVTAREAVHVLARTARFTGDIREIGEGPARSAAVNWIQADIDRAALVLGWRPAYDLERSLEAIWVAAESR
jgi:nucleoside-diphosphate-sugar epimerase